jgi:hypothetical protein
VIYFFITFCSLGSAAKTREIVVRTQVEALKAFQKFISAPSKKIPHIIKPLLAMSFFPKEIDRLRHVAKILGISEDFPFLIKAQRAIAPKILEEISASFIPWKIFYALLHKEELSSLDTERLRGWVHDINMLGALVSPILLLSVFEVAASKAFPDSTTEEQASYASFLSWQLFKAGLKQVSSSEVGSAAYEMACPQHRIGKRLDVHFPFYFQVAAHEVEDEPNFMALRSPAPLLLGAWYFNLQEIPPLIPYIKCYSLDLRGRYMITERIVSSLERYCWNEKGEEKDFSLLKKFSTVISLLLHVKDTPLLDPDKFLLTSDHNIRLLSPLKKRGFFCLHALEKFIHSVCKHDQSLVHQVFQHADVFQHPEAQFYISLLENYRLDLTDDILHDEIKKANLPEAIFPYVQKWYSTFLKKADQIYERIELDPAWETKHLNYIKSSIVRATLILQKQQGFVTVFPETFVSDAIELINQPETKAEYLSLSFLKKIFQ